MRSVKERALQEVDETLMAKSGGQGGICLICQNRSSCTYARDPKWPVVQCEEFVGYEDIADRMNGKVVLQLQDPVFRFSPKKFRKFQRVV